MFVVKASNASLFPNTYEVEAVGIGATNKEFHIPYFLIYSFKSLQGYIVGLAFHMSNYNIPLLAGLP